MGQIAENGKLPKSSLARVFDGGGLTVYLANDAAAAWNTFALYSAERKDWGTPAFNGPNSAYRTYEKQVEYWNAYQRGGSLAARPGTSNHGWGKAGDVNNATQAIFRGGGGGPFGWKKTEAFGEPWHWNYVGGFNRPDPGIDRKNPKLRKGSGGPGQDKWVKEAQRLLEKHKFGGGSGWVDGSYGDGVEKAVKEFQKANGLKEDGRIGTKKLWRLLRKEPENDD